MITRRRFAGLELSIEIPANGFRRGINQQGEKWEKKISHAYGYILGTNSPDGEHLDCYIEKNPDPTAKVYVVHQLTPDGSRYDEDKVMLGFSSLAKARRAFKDNTFKPSLMYGGISEFDIDHFKVIAYQASKSKAILASAENYQKLKNKLPRGIKNPIEVSKLVSEGHYYIRDMYGFPLKDGPISPDLSVVQEVYSTLGAVSSLYSISRVGGSSKMSRIITEGLSAGDMEGLIIPRISVDEYVPKEKKDNVVIAFFIKNAPEAVEPLRLYCDKCFGVDDTDSGDSETIKNTSIVYVEFPNGFKLSHMTTLIDEVASIANMESGDFSLKFSSSPDLIPYSPDALFQFFEAKSKKSLL